MSEKIRFKHNSKSDMESLLEIVRSTKFHMDLCLQKDNQGTYILMSHPFMDKEDAITYGNIYESYFRECEAVVNDFEDGRYFLYLDMKNVYADDLRKFISDHKVYLFQPPDTHYNNKRKEDADEILRKLKRTNMILDNYRWSRSMNAYYLVSNTFPKNMRDHSLHYCDIFRQAFGVMASDVYTDYVGRSYVNLDPNAIDKIKFDAFIKHHRMDLFHKRRSEATIQETISDFYTHNVRDVEELIAELRKTKYPLDSYFYDEENEAYYIISAVFFDKRDAVAFAIAFMQAFGEEAVAQRADEEGRHYVFLDPSCVNIKAFKLFVDKNSLNTFADEKRVKQLDINRSKLGSRKGPKNLDQLNDSTK